MNRRKAVAALTLAPLACAQTKHSTVRNKFVGVWKLVSCESKDKTTGKVGYPYGTKPVGRITYDGAGRMSAQLMNPDRRKIGGSPVQGSVAVIRDASPEDMRDILTGFTSYFGTFDLDESSHTVTHHVQAHLMPGWVGSDMRRNYEFSGDNQLILTAVFTQSTNRLIWQRDT